MKSVYTAVRFARRGTPTSRPEGAIRHRRPTVRQGVPPGRRHRNDRLRAAGARVAGRRRAACVAAESSIGADAPTMPAGRVMPVMPISPDEPARLMDATGSIEPARPSEPTSPTVGRRRRRAPTTRPLPVTNDPVPRPREPGTPDVAGSSASRISPWPCPGWPPLPWRARYPRRRPGSAIPAASGRRPARREAAGRSECSFPRYRYPKHCQGA